jgi:hypothetical protein
MPVGSDTYKRTKSLLQTKPEVVLDIADKWKHKSPVKDSLIKTLNTYERIYVPASNIERKPEDGCMKKIKLERSLKLRKEDFRNRTFNPVTNNAEDNQSWMMSYGGQKEDILPKVSGVIDNFHNEKSQIASGMTAEDRENEKLRVNISYKPKMNITH